MLADLIRGSFRNTKILSGHPRLGPVAGGSRAGYQHNSNLEKNSTISELNCLTTLVGAHTRLSCNGARKGLGYPALQTNWLIEVTSIEVASLFCGVPLNLGLSPPAR
jgi:hypothetical protein